MSVNHRREKATKLHRLPSRPGEIPSEGQSCPNSPAVKKVYRLVVLGAARAGKTSIVDRFLDREFEDRYIPTIENFHRKLYKIRGDAYQLDILDSSGNDPFPAARKLSYLSGDMFIIVGAVDCATSVEAMFDIAYQVRECKATRGVHSEVPIVYALNKTDLPEHRWQIQCEDVQSRVTSSGSPAEALQICSAATNTNIDKVFGRAFSLGKCPKHMNPELHKMLRNELSADGDSRKPSRHILRRMRSKFSKDGEDELSVYTDLNARRPSLRTDLLLNRAKTSVIQKDFSTERSCREPEGHKCCIM